MTPRPHIRVPSALQYSDVSAGARDLWATLDDLARHHIGVEATGPFLSRALDCSAATLRRHRTELVTAGWLYYEAAWGRGVPSVWVPLHRARTVTDRTLLPVDNRVPAATERRSPVSVFDLGKTLTDERLSAGPYKDPAREEAEAGSSPRHPVTACGVCDPDTPRWIEQPDGAYLRCPSCHPSKTQEPAF